MYNKNMDALNKLVAELNLDSVKVERLPEYPERKDLFPFLGKRLKTKRLRKKFLDHFDSYLDNKRFIPDVIAQEYNQKRWRKLGKVLGEEMYSVLSRKSFLRQVLTIAPIAQGMDK